jgi:uncharacterized protein YybS (DUF2232 family)
MVAATETTSPQRRFRPGPALAGFLSFAALASLAFVPVLGALFALLAAVPLVHLVAEGRPSLLGWGWVSVVLAGSALLWQSVWLAAVLLAYLLLAVLPAVAVEAWVRHPWPTGRWTAGITGIALAAVAAFSLAVYLPAHPAEALAERLQAAVTETAKTFGALGGGPEAAELLAAGVKISAYLAPAVSALFVLAAALWLRPRLPLLGLPRGGEPFAFYASEEWLPLGFAVGGLGWVFAPPLPKWLATNLFVAVLGLYFLHGIAIIHFYLGRRLGTNRWVRLAVALIALQVPVALALSALGLTDAFFRLRRGGAYDGGSES